jgi:glycosyltransferase involved in cell wall biosynthesis
VRLSIGMPVYNGENYVAEAIKSIVDQTYGDFRLVISDNGSTDATYDICRELAVCDNRIEVVRHEQNRGAAWNYEQVRALASGTELFKWAAHDDVLAPTFLARCIEALDANPSAALAFAGVAAIDANGAVSRIKHRLVHPMASTPHKRFRQVVMSFANCDAVFGVMRSAVLPHTRGHGDYCSADRVFLAEVAIQGPFVEVPEVLFFNRDHPSRSTKITGGDFRKLTAWFNPARPEQFMPYWRLWREYAEAARRAPVDEIERRRLYAELLWFLPKHAGKLVGDVGFAARRVLRPWSAPSGVAAPVP